MLLNFPIKYTGYWAEIVFRLCEQLITDKSNKTITYFILNQQYPGITVISYLLHELWAFCWYYGLWTDLMLWKKWDATTSSLPRLLAYTITVYSYFLNFIMQLFFSNDSELNSLILAQRFFFSIFETHARFLRLRTSFRCLHNCLSDVGIKSNPSSELSYPCCLKTNGLMLGTTLWFNNKRCVSNEWILASLIYLPA